MDVTPNTTMGRSGGPAQHWMGRPRRSPMPMSQSVPVKSFKYPSINPRWSNLLEKNLSVSLITTNGGQKVRRKKYMRFIKWVFRSFWSHFELYLSYGLFVYTIICSNTLNLMSRGPVLEVCWRRHFFFFAACSWTSV